jgi:murein DD-endopeptidase MepM/ murein hydrolase activator NlpD
MWIIDWLLTRYNQLYYLLDVWYNELKRFAVNGFDYWTRKIDDARNYLLGQISYWYNQSIKAVNDLNTYLSGQIAYWYNKAIKAKDDLGAYLSGQINYWYNQAIKAVNDLKKWAGDEIIYWYNKAIKAINDTSAYLLKQINDLIKGVGVDLDKLKLYLLKQINDFISDALKKVLEWLAPLTLFINKWGPFLLGFFNQPGAYIWGFIEIYIYPWAEWYLAYILGGVNIPPPVRPNFWGAGAGGAVGTPPPGGSGSLVWVWPTVRHDISGYHFEPGHPGIDIGESNGDPIMAAEAGIIIFMGWTTNGYGNLIKIAHREGWETRYAHLMSFATALGQNVTPGQLIAFADSTGNSTGPHLHFEMRKDGTPYDPLGLLPRQ